MLKQKDMEINLQHIYITSHWSIWSGEGLVQLYIASLCWFVWHLMASRHLSNNTLNRQKLKLSLINSELCFAPYHKKVSNSLRGGLLSFDLVYCVYHCYLSSSLNVAALVSYYCFINVAAVVVLGLKASFLLFVLLLLKYRAIHVRFFEKCSVTHPWEDFKTIKPSLSSRTFPKCTLFLWHKFISLFRYLCNLLQWH